MKTSSSFLAISCADLGFLALASLTTKFSDEQMSAYLDQDRAGLAYLNAP